MENLNEISKRILTLKRTLNAPRKLVWEAWTEADHIVRWWAPAGMNITVIKHEFKPGGQWKYIMPMPDGSEFISEGIYSEIIPYEKIITTADFKPMTEGVVLHVLFEEEGDKTNFTFSVVHATEEYCKQQEKMGFYNGWGTAFDRMEKYLVSEAGR
ncbi:SRPBCC domain-containing protein [Niastella populi]|uniref:Activator of HSP90 ATPase n=1 Tax=Niastella populi TaxID=550983 RepID=A0A1V9FKI0_9BACT|nr:SRPBCC domain-containing protein [Niastella populi]OQP58879.1 activator of HSP90 ATPase [Niastella populi]